MYKLLLCWRYLRTRYIALASIISVMLGVATMIVVNAVMAGFTHEMQDRIHGILSDLVFESVSLDGFPDADRRMAEIRKVAGRVHRGHVADRACPGHARLFGRQSIHHAADHDDRRRRNDVRRRSAISASILQHPENRKQLDFQLKHGGYDTIDHQATDPSKVLPRTQMQGVGWEYRKRKAQYMSRISVPEGSLKDDPFQQAHGIAERAAKEALGQVGATAEDEGTTFDPAKEQHTGCVLGIGLCAYRNADGADGFLVLPGDDVQICYPTAAKPPKVAGELHGRRFLRKQDERIRLELRVRADSQAARTARHDRSDDEDRQLQCDSDQAQERRRSGHGPRPAASQLSAAGVQDQLVARQARRAAGRRADGNGRAQRAAVPDHRGGRLRHPGDLLHDRGREDPRHRHPEIARRAEAAASWASFSATAVASASSGPASGLGIGLLFVRYINEIADLLGRITGQPVFDPSIYYFQKIPTIVEWFTVTLDRDRRDGDRRLGQHSAGAFARRGCILWRHFAMSDTNLFPHDVRQPRAESVGRAVGVAARRYSARAAVS